MASLAAWHVLHMTQRTSQNGRRQQGLVTLEHLRHGTQLCASLVIER